eukprot:SAG22_NODE_48_length_24654_cov_4.406394_28_plen_66_part_01
MLLQLHLSRGHAAMRSGRSDPRPAVDRYLQLKNLFDACHHACHRVARRRGRGRRSRRVGRRLRSPS